MVYSIGMFAHYLLTADVRMKATTARGMAMRHIASARLPMTPDRFSGCSDAFMDVIVKMIQPNRAYRHQSFEEVAEDVAALLAAAQAG